MKQQTKNSMNIMQVEQYESPRIEVIEMELEGVILSPSNLPGLDEGEL